MNRNVKTAKFAGAEYSIHFVELMGLCDRADRTITIDPRQCGLDMLDSIIHESLHAAYPDMSEEDVGAGAADIANLLWRLGYRTKSKGK